MIFYFMCFLGPVYTRVNGHRIYIDPDYVEFTQCKICSDSERLHNTNSTLYELHLA